TSPVARPNPSSTWPPKFLALPVRRSSFMGVILLRFASSTARAGVGSHCAAEMATTALDLAAQGKCFTPREQACGGRFASHARARVFRDQTIPSRRPQRACRRPAEERAYASRRRGSLELHHPALWGRAKSRACAPPAPTRPARSFGGATTDS